MPTRRKYASNAERQAAYRSRLAARTKAESSKRQQSDTSESRIPSRPGYTRWDAMLSQARSLTQSVFSEMSIYYEARSEAWQCSESGESLAEKLESLEEIVDLLDVLPPTHPEP